MIFSIRALCITSALLAILGGTAQSSNSTKGPLRKGGKCTGRLCAFNPALRGGQIGGPGLKARLNPRMFEYSAQIVAELLNREIQHAKLPEIIQTTGSLLDGRMVMYNGYVDRYRCPQRVFLASKAPNILVLQLQNFDMGINAKIAGHLDMMVPMATETIVPSGVLQIDLSGMILAVEIGMENGPRGASMTVVSCSTYIDKINISMEKGARGGNATTISYFKKFVSKFVRDLLPKELCKMVPKVVDEQINTMIAKLPKIILLPQLAATTGIDLFSARSEPDPAYCTNTCGITPAKSTIAPPKGFPGIDQMMKSLSDTLKKAPSKGPFSVHYPCSLCPISTEASMAQSFAKTLNLQKLSDMYLGVKLLNSSATEEGFAIELTGEFSPKGKGGTPFGPHPTAFPAAHNKRMLEAIASDFTTNSLLYWAHRKGFFSFYVGPESPMVGELLQTTCVVTASSEEDEEAPTAEKKTESLTDAGFCLGDLLPEVRVSYPDEKFYIRIYTKRAPSLVLSAANGGSASVDVQVEADLFLHKNKTKVGTLNVAVKVNLSLQLRAKKLFGSIEVNSNLTDPTGSLGLSQQSLDNHTNDALEEGVPVNIQQNPAQPSTFHDVQIKIIDHGLYVASDVTMAPALLGTLIYDGTCYQY